MVIGVITHLGTLVIVDAMAGNEGSARIHAVLERCLFILVEVFGSVARTTALFENLGDISNAVLLRWNQVHTSP